MSITGLEPLAPGRPRVGSVVMLYLVRLRRRWAGELMAALAVAAGVALVYTASVASTLPSESVRALSDGLVGDSQLQLIARGGTRMPEDFYARIVALPGVRRVAPVLQVPGNVIGRRGEQGLMFFGADPRSVRLNGSLLDGFTGNEMVRQEALVLTSPVARAIGVRFGDDARVQLSGRTLTLPAIVAGREQIGALVDTAIVMVPLRYLQRLARTGREVSRMLVEAQPGRLAEAQAGLRRLVAGTNVEIVPADHESRMYATATRPAERMTRAFGVLAALAGGLFAACALLVAAGDRRALVRHQRMQGVRPAARVATLVVDALAVGVVGTALGLALGEALSRAGSGAISEAGVLMDAFPVTDRRVVTWESVALAVGSGLGAAAIGVLVALLRGGDRRRRRVVVMSWLGVACLASAIVVLVAAPGGAVVAGLVLLALALVLVVPVGLAGAVGAFEAANRGLGRPSNAVELAVQYLKIRRWRAGALAVALTAAVTVFAATALRGTEQGLEAGLDRTTALTAPAGIWVAPPGSGSMLGTTPFSPGSTAAAIAAQPGVARVSAYRSALLDVARRRAWVVGVGVGDTDSAVLADEVVSGDAGDVTARIRGGGWATLSAGLARALGVGVGDTFVLPAPRPVRLRVAATTTNLGWPSGSVVIGADDFRRAWTSDAVTGYRTVLAAGVSDADGRRQVTSAVERGTPLRVETAQARADRQRSAAHAGLTRVRQIALLTLLAGLLATGATVAALLRQHRSHVAGLKSHGPTTGLMWRTLLIETGVLLGAGAALGALFGVLGQVLATKGLAEATDFPVVITARPGVAVAVAAVVVGVALAVAVVAGYAVARARPAWRH
ncbi:ABC transporter permease [Baekduia sp. Peel2402]|uniref:ABC transporter permease n=1 Tax=Baekduia sp. Peel2402 TaxID=3458296 RepID=UPI00403EE6A7